MSQCLVLPQIMRLKVGQLFYPFNFNPHLALPFLIVGSEQVAMQQGADLNYGPTIFVEYENSTDLDFVIGMF